MHGFSRDGKAGFGIMFPLRWRNMDSSIVASAGIGKGEEFLPVAGVKEPSPQSVDPLFVKPGRFDEFSLGVGVVDQAHPMAFRAACMTSS